MSQVVHYEDAQTLRILIDLADNKRDVRTTTDYANSVVVPDELYERYLFYRSLDPSAPEETELKEKES